MIEKGLWPLFLFPVPQASIRFALRLRYASHSGFDTLRTQASIRFATQPARISPWTEWTAVTESIKGHNTITAGFDTLRTQPADKPVD
jgi:hypothetical protein